MAKLRLHNLKDDFDDGGSNAQQPYTVSQLNLVKRGRGRPKKGTGKGRGRKQSPGGPAVKQSFSMPERMKERFDKYCGTMQINPSTALQALIRERLAIFEAPSRDPADAYLDDFAPPQPFDLPQASMLEKIALDVLKGMFKNGVSVSCHDLNVPQEGDAPMHISLSAVYNPKDRILTLHTSSSANPSTDCTARAELRLPDIIVSKEPPSSGLQEYWFRARIPFYEGIDSHVPGALSERVATTGLIGPLVRHVADKHGLDVIGPFFAVSGTLEDCEDAIRELYAGYRGINHFFSMRIEREIAELNRWKHERR